MQCFLKYPPKRVAGNTLAQEDLQHALGSHFVARQLLPVRRRSAGLNIDMILKRNQPDKGFPHILAWQLRPQLFLWRGGRAIQNQRPEGMIHIHNGTRLLLNILPYLLIHLFSSKCQLFGIILA